MLMLCWWMKSQVGDEDKNGSAAGKKRRHIQDLLLNWSQLHKASCVGLDIRATTTPTAIEMVETASSLVQEE